MLLNCKFCGGELDFAEGERITTCKYCRTAQTLPIIKDEKASNLFNRANSLRRRCDFDKAEAAFEKIIENDGTEAEAYWGLVLSRYGIEYVEDPESGKMIPTCHRASYDSIVADGDYKSALEYADEERKALYIEQAKEIDRIQKDILALAENEEKYDVFICYKETDENGKRTKDSATANEIYYELTDAGFKVFYAAVTLDGKIGSEYEPVIFSALNSAKVMLVIGSKPEYFNAVWVKNEWSRFLKIMKNDRKKRLIPCYRDMDAYELPEEFVHIQSQNMEKMAFLIDLIQGVKKVIASFDDKPALTVKEKETVIKETVIKEPVIKETTVIKEQGGAPVSGGTNISALVKRIFAFLEDGEFDSANEYCERVLDEELENADAYLGKLMASLRVRKKADLKNCDKPFDENIHFKKALKYGDEALKAELNGYVKDIKARNEAARKEKLYKAAVTDYNSSDVQRIKKAANTFESLKDYGEAGEYVKKCRDKIQRLEKMAEQRRIEQAQRQAEAFLAEKEKKEAEQREKERRAELARIEAQKRKKRKIKIAAITTSALCVLIAFIIVLNSVIIPNTRYSKAVSLMNEGRYTEAIAYFRKVEDHKDSAALIVECLLKRTERFISEYGQAAYDKFGVVEVGATVTFGKYAQDSGFNENPVEWLVLDVKDGKALLISKYGIASQLYHNSDSEVTWETSSIRSWLNNSFINSAFSSEDVSYICTTLVTADANPDHPTSVGNDTEDKMFLLSIDEANRYFDSEKARKCIPTYEAAYLGVYYDSNSNCMWWLRTQGQRPNSASYVGTSGGISESGDLVCNKKAQKAIRPAMWIDLNP